MKKIMVFVISLALLGSVYLIIREGNIDCIKREEICMEPVGDNRDFVWELFEVKRNEGLAMGLKPLGLEAERVEIICNDLDFEEMEMRAIKFFDKYLEFDEMSTTVNEPAERFALSQTLYEWITKNSIDLECCVRMGADIMYKKDCFWERIRKLSRDRDLREKKSMGTSIDQLDFYLQELSFIIDCSRRISGERRKFLTEDEIKAEKRIMIENGSEWRGLHAKEPVVFDYSINNDKLPESLDIYTSQYARPYANKLNASMSCGPVALFRYECVRWKDGKLIIIYAQCLK
ncbi:MAG: hypothetical protein IJB89_06360 [Akkermansia sp.]|nr:hypothetical protein [Akkermansia sp.]